MKRIRIIALFLMLISPLAGRGQESPEARINRIKADTGYLFGEGTMATQEEAIGLAQNILRTNIEAWRKEQPDPKPETEELLARSEQILAMRGPRHRAFVYTKKPGGTEPEPPVVSDPPKDEPTGQTSEDPAPVAVWSFPFDKLCACRNLMDVLTLCEEPEIKPHIESGNVSRSSDLEEVGRSLLVIYASADNSVRAVFDKKNEVGNRINLLTKKPDSSRNYPGCQAMWIKIKE